MKDNLEPAGSGSRTVIQLHLSCQHYGIMNFNFCQFEALFESFFEFKFGLIELCADKMTIPNGIWHFILLKIFLAVN